MAVPPDALVGFLQVWVKVIPQRRLCGPTLPEVPELRIVDDGPWQAAKARQTELAHIFAATTGGVREARAQRINSARRHAFLLSGLLVCGCCRGKYGIMTKERYGCLNHHRRVSCSNNR